MKKRLLNKKFYIPAAIIVVIIVVLSLRQEKEAYTYASVVRADVVQEISVTGKVKPVQSVSLSFEQGGRISSVAAKVGDTVSAGQSLVRLDTTSLALSLAQEEARLNELLAGTRPEDIAILESKLSAAQTSLVQEKQAAIDSIHEAYTVSDDAIHNYADQFFDNARTSNPQLNIPVSENQLKIDLINQRYLVEVMLAEWQGQVSVTANADLPGLIDATRTNVETVKSLLDKLALAVNALSPNYSISASTISSYRTSVSTARTAVNASLTSLTSNETSLSSALAGVDLAEKNLNLARAGTEPEQITAQQAKVAAIRHNLSVSVLRSPISGTVTKQEAKVGEVVSANQIVTSVISENKLEIEAFVPEVDIGVMSVGNSSEVTFDAFPEEVFEARIDYIDPADTVIDGVPTYKITLSLPAEDERIRSGMTVNLSVKVAERVGALTLPFRAVFGTNGDRHVFIQTKNGETEEVPIEVGIRGINGEVEIISGLDEGVTVAIPERK